MSAIFRRYSIPSRIMNATSGLSASSVPLFMDLVGVRERYTDTSILVLALASAKHSSICCRPITRFS